MRKIFCLVMISAIMVACGSYRSLDLNRLTTGMTKAEVERVAGLPDRILAVNESREGYQEVLEYRTSRGEIYALEFWDDYLTGYEYLYDDIQYVPAPYPTVFPPYGRPIYVYPGSVYRPNNRPNTNRPNYNYNNNSNNRPNNINRPNNNNSNSNNNNSSTSRPDRNNNSSTATPSETPSRSTSRTNRTNQGE